MLRFQRIIITTKQHQVQRSRVNECKALLQITQWEGQPFQIQLKENLKAVDHQLLLQVTSISKDIQILTTRRSYLQIWVAVSMHNLFSKIQ